MNAGPWWDRYEGSISLPDVKAVRVSVEAGKLRQWRRMVWELEMKDGTVESYTLFDLWMEHYQSVKGHFVSRALRLKTETSRKFLLQNAPILKALAKPTTLIDAYLSQFLDIPN